jgi:diaminopimelate epimerase
LRFFKGHGLGNDYIALEFPDLAGPSAEPSRDAIRLLCDRHRGIGSDGILARWPSDAADFGLRIFNPDGSEAEKSGNGLRIFAAYLLDRGDIANDARFTVETPGGVVMMALLGRSDGVLTVEVEMGRASFSSSALAMPGPERELGTETLELEAGDRFAADPVSLGNPHCVIFQDELDPDDLRRRGPQVCSHPWFGRGTNVQFARVAGSGAVEAWIWERGAGETLTSGSSACAVAAVAVRRGLVTDREVEVRMPGGTLHVTVGEDFEIVLRGPVEGAYRGELAPDLARRVAELSTHVATDLTV